MEHTTAAARVNEAIATLRNDLIEMRIHDVKLMKQLLNINFTIQKMTNERLGQSMKPRKKLKAQTTRQNSVPHYLWLQRENIDSVSSTEDCTSEDISDISDTEDESFSKSSGYALRQDIPSVYPLTEDDADESSDEEILRTNIKLWKYSKSYDID